MKRSMILSLFISSSIFSSDKKDNTDKIAAKLFMSGLTEDQFIKAFRELESAEESRAVPKRLPQPQPTTAGAAMPSLSPEDLRRLRLLRLSKPMPTPEPLETPRPGSPAPDTLRQQDQQVFKDKVHLAGLKYIVKRLEEMLHSGRCKDHTHTQQALEKYQQEINELEARLAIKQ